MFYFYIHRCFQNFSERTESESWFNNETINLSEINAEGIALKIHD